jgi:hypothetical protein
MKLIWNGLEIELTVDELKQMVEKGLISPEDDKIPYPEEWKDMIRKLPRVQPGLNPPPNPHPFGVVAVYGCQMPNPIQCTNDPHWDGTTTLGKTATHIIITSDTSAENSAGKTTTFVEDSTIEGIADNKE